MASKNDPRAVQDILAALQKDPTVGRQFEIAKVWREWPLIVGEELAPYGQPLGVRDETLIVEVESSVWMHRYAAAKWRILHQINGVIKGNLLRELFFVLTSEVEDAMDALAPQDDVE